MEAGKTNKPKKRDRIGVILYVFYVFMLLMSIVLIGGIVYIQLKPAHDGKVVPELLLVVDIRSVLGRHAVHNGHDRLGALLPLLPVGNGHAVVDHILYLAPIFGKDELLALGVVV